MQRKGKKRRVVNVRVLPGQPTDGSGQVCIHFVLQDERGPFTEPHVLHPVYDEQGNLVKQQLQAKPTRCRLACDSKRKVAPIEDRKSHVTTITPRTDDPRAVTCPKCKATSYYTEAMQRNGG